ncbi:YdeI/OmpD-associated family protein [Mesorhizobium sp. AR02]|uniref:YdeI/OmpD-associated family protein n=1 Tax=Mesorhizobium sp. AR02 TaxID=2865837 RepID=UPI00215E0062|nr:YdeI/OmpD-associated family protein [Mesorhizobium sp. AR02]UVK50647.1 YdeI/OmpD-associated family protein [Mesorhizobium sp. AR02]
MTGLKRALNPMPDAVRAALAERRLMTAYEARPDYQRNDYLGWIGRAKRPDTRRKRLDQMLDELQRGGVYMNMVWHG